MYNLLKTLCETNEWYFEYSRRDFTNLYDGEEEVGDNTPMVFLDVVQLTENYDETNSVVSTTQTGSFMILVSSDIDEEDYDYRYQTYIKPTITTTLESIKTEIKCDGTFQIRNWRLTEVINALDFNADGIIVNFTLENE